MNTQSNFFKTNINILIQEDYVTKKELTLNVNGSRKRIELFPAQPTQMILVRNISCLFICRNAYCFFTEVRLAFCKNRPFCEIPVFGQKVRLTPLLFCKNRPFGEIPIFGQKVRLTPLLNCKSRPFSEILIFRQKSKVNPFAFLQKQALFRNTDFWAKSKVNPFAFLQKLALFRNTDFWVKSTVNPFAFFCNDRPFSKIPIFGQKVRLTPLRICKNRPFWRYRF